jgi:glycosyltransferase involved in cell wall biosynthesis
VEVHLAKPCADLWRPTGCFLPDEQRWLYDEGQYFYLHRLLRSVVPIEIIRRTRGLSPHVFLRLYQCFRLHRPHVVQTWGWLSGFYGIASAIAASVPIVVRGERVASSPDSAIITWRKSITDKIFDRFVSAVVTNSISGAIELRRSAVPVHKIHTIKNGIEEFSVDEKVVGMLRAKYHLDPETFVVGMVANLRPQKNFAMFLRAIQRLQRRIRLKAAIVGAGPLRNSIEQMIRALHIEEIVVMVGLLPDIRPIYGCFDALALTSYIEGFPNAIGEAMVAGVPVVATDVPGTRDLIKSGVNGFLVPTDDDESLANKLYELASDPKLRERLAALARRQVLDQYSISRMVRRYEKLYETLYATAKMSHL